MPPESKEEEKISHTHYGKYLMPFLIFIDVSTDLGYTCVNLGKQHTTP